jgi:transcriptional regulator with XRE-family HTH domain
MASRSVGTHLRYLRRKSGLSQRDLARILGTVSASQVSRHERSRTLPTLLAAFGYQVVFEKPVSDIFPGLFHAVQAGIEERLRECERELNNGAAKRPAAESVEWHMNSAYDWDNEESF